MKRYLWIGVLLCVSLCGCHSELASGLRNVFSEALANAQKDRVQRQARKATSSVIESSWFVDAALWRQPIRPWQPGRCQPGKASDWFLKAKLLASQNLLKPLLRKKRVWIPWGSHMLVTGVVPGVGQPAFVYHSYKETGFAHSRGRFWPASSVKLMAAVGALVRLNAHGLDGDTYLRFKDRYGTYKGSLYPLYRRAIGRSTNRDYDRLVTVATQLQLNRDVLHPRYGMPNLSIRCAYGWRGSLAQSPAIFYKKSKKSKQEGALPPRVEPKNKDKRCPYHQNCTTLFELQEGLRRVMLHKELPKSERFQLPKKDLKRLQKALLTAWSAYILPVRHEWGKGAKIWNKGGLHKPHDHIENTYIEGEKGQRLFIALTVRFSKRRPGLPQTLAVHQYVSRGLLRSYEEFAKGPPLQLDAGHPMRLAIRRYGTKGRLSIQTRHSVERANVWLNTQKLSAEQVGPGQFEVSFAWPSAKSAFVIQGMTGEKPTTYRSLLFEKAGVWRPTCR